MPFDYSYNPTKAYKNSLTASSAIIQVPWIKVVIGDYTFGVFSRSEKNEKGTNGQYYTAYNVTYPNFVQRLSIKKVNGQVNQYTLNLSYPVRQTDDPNFFEKVFSSISKTRKIIFSYGDMSMPSYVYKNEEAIMTGYNSNFDFPNAVINYVVTAVSSSSLNKASNFTFPGGVIKPSDVIKELVLGTTGPGIHALFYGVTRANINQLIDGDDKMVTVESKTNISTIDYITYLVGCMIPNDNTTNDSVNNGIYILSFHDDTTYDKIYNDDVSINGPYLKIKKVTNQVERPDALELNAGFGNTGIIVRKLNIAQNDGYSLMYDYNNSLEVEQYTQKLNSQGKWENVYAPTVTSRNDRYLTRAEDLRWWTVVTKYPITATVEIQGLLRAAQLMTYVRLNVIFPGGRKHMASGLYLITSQTDEISERGYITTLGLTRISGDTEGPIAK